MEIHFSGRYAQKDLQRGLRLMQGRRPKLNAVIGVIYLAVLLFFLLFVINPITLKSVETGTLFAGLAIILFPFLLLAYVWFLPQIQARQLRNAPLFQGEVSGVATDKMLELHTGSSEGRTKWDAYVQYRMSDDIILLYQNKATAQMIPRSFFASDADWQRFKQHIQATIPKKAKKKGR